MFDISICVRKQSFDLRVTERSIRYADCVAIAKYHAYSTALLQVQNQSLT